MRRQQLAARTFAAPSSPMLVHLRAGGLRLRRVHKEAGHLRRPSRSSRARRSLPALGQALGDKVNTSASGTPPWEALIEVEADALPAAIEAYETLDSDGRKLAVEVLAGVPDDPRDARARPGAPRPGPERPLLRRRPGGARARRGRRRAKTRGNSRSARAPCWILTSDEPMSQARGPRRAAHAARSEALLAHGGVVSRRTRSSSATPSPRRRRSGAKWTPSARWQQAVGDASSVVAREAQPIALGEALLTDSGRTTRRGGRDRERHDARPSRRAHATVRR